MDRSPRRQPSQSVRSPSNGSGRVNSPNNNAPSQENLLVNLLSGSNSILIITLIAIISIFLIWWYLARYSSDSVESEMITGEGEGEGVIPELGLTDKTVPG